jgi:hypothetical protein
MYANYANGNIPEDQSMDTDSMTTLSSMDRVLLLRSVPLLET